MSDIDSIIILEDLDNSVLGEAINFSSISSALSSLSKVADRYLVKVSKKLADVLLKLVNKLSPAAKNTIVSDLSKSAKNIERLSKASIDQNKINKSVERVIQDYISRAGEDKDINRYLLDNRSKILSSVKDQISNDLKPLKSSVHKEVTRLEKVLKSSKLFAVGASYSFVFGLIDNAGLFLGMEGIEDFILQAGFDSQVAAGFGNTFSDAVGALAGGMVSTALYKLLNVKGEGNTTQQFVGVIIGCLIPVGIKMCVQSLSI